MASAAPDGSPTSADVQGGLAKSESFSQLDRDSSGSGGVGSFEDVEYVEEPVEEAVFEEVETHEDAGAGTSHPAVTEEPTAVAIEAVTETVPKEPPPHSGQAAQEQEDVESENASEGQLGEQVHDEEDVEEGDEEVEAAGDQEPGAQRGDEEVPTGQAGVDYDLKQLEVQAAKVARDVQEVAKNVSTKFTAGLFAAFGGAAEATKGVAGGLTNWWSTLDPLPVARDDETMERIQNSGKASSELQELFGLSPEENLVEQFKCKLLQTYACSHNAYTPAIQMAFQGTLYITDRHTCFSVEERGRKLPFKVDHTQTVRATRQRSQRKGDLSDILKLEMTNGNWLSFKDFESGSALDSALALVEHLMSD